jgi:hypothetical protein
VKRQAMCTDEVIPSGSTATENELGQHPATTSPHRTTLNTACLSKHSQHMSGRHFHGHLGPSL